MLKQGMFLDADTLNRLFLSKTAMGTQTISSSLQIPNNTGIRSDAGASITTGVQGNTWTFRPGTSATNLINIFDFLDTSQFVITYQNRVGIGVATPTARVHIATPTGIMNNLLLDAVDTGTSITMKTGSNSISFSGNVAGALTIATAANQTLVMQNGNTGKVAIGRADAIDTLHVGGKIHADTSVKIAGKYELYYNNTTGNLDFLFIP